jgi:hypothetical protein
MRYEVQWGNKQYVVGAGNPIHACMNIIREAGIQETVCPYFRVNTLDTYTEEEIIGLAEVITFMVMANNPDDPMDWINMEVAGGNHATISVETVSNLSTESRVLLDHS